MVGPLVYSRPLYLGVMDRTIIHVMRHGEVDNPDGVLYGRLPGFGLTELGHAMAARALSTWWIRVRILLA